MGSDKQTLFGHPIVVKKDLSLPADCIRMVSFTNEIATRFMIEQAMAKYGGRLVVGPGGSDCVDRRPQ